MMFESIKQKLIKLLGGVPIVTEEYVTMQMPTEAQFRDAVGKEVSKQFQAKLAQQETELILLKKKLENIKEQDKEAEEFKKVLDLAREHEVKEKKKDKHKKVMLLLTVKNLPKLKLKDEGLHPDLVKFPYLAGFQLSEYKNGEFEWVPVLTDKKKTGKYLLQKGSVDFREMFGKTIHIPSQLNNESFPSNFSITSDEQLILHSNMMMDNATGERMKVIRMDDVERGEYDKELNIMRNQVRRFQALAIEANERETSLNNKIMEYELKIGSLLSEASNSKKLVGQALERHKKIGKRFSDQQLSSQDLILNQQLSEQAFITLKHKFDALVKKYGELLPVDKRGLVKKDLMKDLKQVSDMFDKYSGKGIDADVLAKSVVDEMTKPVPKTKRGKK